MVISCLQPQWKLFPTSLIFGTYPSFYSFLQNLQTNPCKLHKDFLLSRERRLVGNMKRVNIKACGWLLLVDPWAPNIDSQSIASQLFAFSLFPYLGFLYVIPKSKSPPKLTLFVFYFLLAFVGATTKLKYGSSLSNVKWLHGGAESLLTLTNLFIVIGLRQALRKAKDVK